MKKEITKDTTLSQVLQYAGAEEVLLKYGLPCLHCGLAQFESESLKLGEVAKAYGIDAENMIKELNKNLKNNKKQ